MVGQQLTPEQRNCLVMAYERNKGKFKFMTAVTTDYQQKFPGAKVPHINTIKNVHNKQMKYFTTHNLNSKASPGDTHSGRPRTVRTPPNLQAEKDVLDRDSAKDLNDPVASPVSSARRNVLGFSKSSWSRIVQDINYHPYKIVRSQLLKPQDFNRRLHQLPSEDHGVLRLQGEWHLLQPEVHGRLEDQWGQVLQVVQAQLCSTSESWKSVVYSSAFYIKE